jgi:hypothetical protein
MLQDDLINDWNSWLKSSQWQAHEGEEFRDPPLDVLAYGVKAIRLSYVPVFGRGLAVVAMSRHPIDLKSDTAGLKLWIERLAKAVNGLVPPWKSFRPGAVLLIAVQLTPEPINGSDEDQIKPVLGHWTGTRVVPAGIVRINLGQNAMSSVLAEGLPRDLPEIGQLVDQWSSHFQRFVPMWSETEDF